MVLNQIFEAIERLAATLVPSERPVNVESSQNHLLSRFEHHAKATADVINKNTTGIEDIKKLLLSGRQEAEPSLRPSGPVLPVTASLD